MAKPWAKAFYNSVAWRDTREAYMVSKHGLCERCGKPGLIVHHRKALRPQDMNDPARTLGWSNLELLCHHCHDIEHMAKHSGARCGFDDDGNLLPPIRAAALTGGRPHPPLKFHRVTGAGGV